MDLKTRTTFFMRMSSMWMTGKLLANTSMTRTVDDIKHLLPPKRTLLSAVSTLKRVNVFTSNKAWNTLKQTVKHYGRQLASRRLESGRPQKTNTVSTCNTCFLLKYKLAVTLSEVYAGQFNIDAYWLLFSYFVECFNFHYSTQFMYANPAFT